MDEKRLNELYSNLLIDSDFEKLELMRNQPNIFEILGVSHFEIRHSHFLAWLFDPKGNHGIGDYFLKRFLLDIVKDDRADFNVLQIHDLLQNNIIIHREKFNIDILIEFDKTIIVIENKIHASEGGDQLQRYKNSVLKHYPNKKPVFVYLTKYGNEASMNDTYIECSYQNHILNYLNELVKYKRESLQEHVLIYIKDYINNLNNNVMKQSEANVLAEKIYRQHQELFDFIIDNRPDYIHEFGILLTNFLKNKGFVIGSDNRGYVRFTTKKLAELFQTNTLKNIPWKYNEPFLFEIFFNLKGRFLFMATTSPTNEEVKFKLNSYLDNIPEHNKKESGGWTNYINKRIPRESVKNILNFDNDQIHDVLENLLSIISKDIENIETMFMEKEYEIKSLK